MSAHIWSEESWEGTVSSGYRHCLVCKVFKTVPNQNEECLGEPLQPPAVQVVPANAPEDLFTLEVLHHEVGIVTCNLAGVRKLELYSSEDSASAGGLAQTMVNTSTLPTISKEELALLKAADEMFNGLSSDWEDEKAAYRIAEANFMATRKEF